MHGRIDSGRVAIDSSASIERYAEEWLNNRAGKRRTESTVREYSRRFETYIIPSIGTIKVKALTVFHVEDLFDEMARSGLSRSTIKGTRNALSSMLTDAVKAHKLNANVARHAPLPDDQLVPKQRVVPTPEQVLDLLEATADTDLGPLVRLIAGTGCRVGEALAAQWKDLDLDDGWWIVSRTATVDLQGKSTVGRRTKTGDSRRVALTADVVDELRHQSARNAEARLRVGDAWRDLDLVFPTSIGTLRDPHNVRRELKVIAPDFPGSFHGLRHAFATLAVSVLPSDAAVSKVLGHRKTSTTTDLYGHLRDEDARTVVNAYSLSLKGIR
jgi:integrase